MVAAFLHGFVLALGLILPLGVQNFFVFSQGASRSRFVQALPIVLTASVCDTLLIVLAVSGVSLLVLGVGWLKTALAVGGMLFLLYMGYLSWKAKPASSADAEAMPRHTRKLIGYTAMISILNPHAILDTVGVIGTGSLSYSGTEKLVYAGACVLVSWLWFLTLAAAGRIVGRQDRTGRFARVLNKISAVVMWAAAAYLIISL
ncbi:putative amino-acid transporter YisU [Cohnella xylanilytica]|uniref:Amino acid transporter n=1 Tax=Cohnella xylanilytica TaxID=557555 RepID=A0A841UAX1_9BACL|nr:LysE/ArgO family amino acid transporter [Cohnella xylanilytica]MBB6695070.1 amino acid transporter [Cohnella xylanilytica]GIO16430.1 putative amino-acid transporter YisU [Cohnella xylanilytica]